jgi:DNA polymerase elongation subunit (family B)
MVEISSDVLCYDCETRNSGFADPTKDKLRIFGCYSYRTKKYYLLTDKEQIQKTINAHKFLVGFNTEGYDELVLKREGIDIQYKIRIDLYDLFKKRAGGMKIKEGMLKDLLMSYSLDFITQTLGLTNKDTAKKEIDYSLFNKESWTEEEIKLIREYTERDLELTKKLYEWVEIYFEGFKSFLNQDDIDKKRYLTVSIAKFSYKAICKALDWTEEYPVHGSISDDEESIAGGYVAYPAGEEFHDDCFCWDFASLYPHIMIQCNLYGRKKEGILTDRPIWTGNGKWQVEGCYYSDNLSKVGELLKKWYADRVVYKKNGDRREYTIKIILNTIYGILNTPYYIRVHDHIAGGDCTRIGRQWIKFARKTYRDAGYFVLYTDTDSLYIKDPFKNKQKMIELKDKIIDEIKATIPFPQDTFNMALEAEIKHIFFFRGEQEKEEDKEMDQDDFINKSLQLMKKNYIYVTHEGKLEIKNLGIRKKSNSPLSRKIFNEYLAPQIIEKGQIKFSRSYIKNLINDLLSKDITLMAMRKDVGPFTKYEKSKTSLPAQIAQKYGAGIHFMIPNTKGIGVGKGKAYASEKEFSEAHLKYTDIDLSSVWSELSYFLKEGVTKNIFSFEETK